MHLQMIIARLSSLLPTLSKKLDSIAGIICDGDIKAIIERPMTLAYCIMHPGAMTRCDTT